MIITFILAFCSIVYEFLLSQVLSALLGGTFVRYTTTIALYIFALGLGAFFYKKIKQRNSLESLLVVELLLCLLGSMLPVIALLGEAHLSANLAFVFCYSLVIIVGFLSGIELPLLMKIEESKKARGGLRALGVDFLGTFFGCILFPLVFLSHFGVFNTASFIASLNLAVAVYIFSKLESKKRMVPALIIVLCFCVFSYSDVLQHWIVNEVYLK